MDASGKFRKKWSWMNAAKKAHKELVKLSREPRIERQPDPPSFFVHFHEGAFLEVKGGEGEYRASFVDMDTGREEYAISLKPRTWAKVGKTGEKYIGPAYYKNWMVQVRKGKNLVHEHRYNAAGKNVLVGLNSTSLGDTLAWVPYCEEFRVKHKCRMFVSGWNLDIVKGAYPEIEFIKPGTVVEELYARYEVGVFFADRNCRQPRDWRTVPLQRVASDILGLEYREIRPRVDTSNAYISGVKRPKKYVCISEHSTAMCKYWHNPAGWQVLVDELNRMGYNVVGISKEQSGLQNIINAHGNHIDVTMGLLMGCEAFIGLASGLAWLAWALGKPVVMISGFSGSVRGVPGRECADCRGWRLYRVPERSTDTRSGVGRGLLPPYGFFVHERDHAADGAGQTADKAGEERAGLHLRADTEAFQTAGEFQDVPARAGQDIGPEHRGNRNGKKGPGRSGSARRREFDMRICVVREELRRKA